jgi:hypothetical protein
MSNCHVCEWVKAVPLSGRVNANCKDCCARLVNKTRPNKSAGAAMLAAVTRHKANPSRAEILDGVRALATATAMGEAPND